MNAPENMSAYKSLFHIGGIGAFDLYMYLNLEKKKKREEGYGGEINTQVYPQTECPNAPLATLADFATTFLGAFECPLMPLNGWGMPPTGNLAAETAWAV
jgi:hypothetical protein